MAIEEKQQMPTYYPVFLNLENRLCIVVGSGEFAERKVETLLDCSSSVIIVSPHVTSALAELAVPGEGPLDQAALPSPVSAPLPRPRRGS